MNRNCRLSKPALSAWGSFINIIPWFLVDTYPFLYSVCTPIIHSWANGKELNDVKHIYCFPLHKKIILLFTGNPTGLQNPSSELVSPPHTPSPPSHPTKGPSFLMKYSPNDLPGPCCSNHSQGKHWSDECASALHVGGLRGTKTLSALLSRTRSLSPISVAAKQDFSLWVQRFSQTLVILIVFRIRQQPVGVLEKSNSI